MADPKYADLPGIDTSEQDFYECGDLPEDDQHYSPEELESESVAVDEIDTQQSYNKFNPKYVSGNKVDFSDKVKNRDNLGYDIGLSGIDGIETPGEKLQRLKLEVVELQNSISELSKGKEAGDTSAASLLSEVQKLQGQLQSGEIHKKVDEINVLSSSYNRLSAVLKSLQDEAKKSTSKDDKTHGSYNIMIRPEAVQQKQALKLAQLEQRLANIEKVIGKDSSELDVLTSGTKNKSLHEVVLSLETKMNLLDPEKLPQVDTRLQAVLNKLMEINKEKKKSGAEAQGTNKKVDEIYETVQKWSSIGEVLPDLVERLEALNNLHTQASQFSSTLKSMETLQNEISSKLTNASTLQNQLQKSFAENSQTVQVNVASLEKRIQSLLK